MAKICKHIDCNNYVFSNGYCKNHQHLREDKKTKALESKTDLISLPTLLELAQKVFNAYIRLRDNGKACISCTEGKSEQAGHYFTVGMYKGLRFNEINTNGQCALCNCMKYGNLEAYEKGLRKRYGKKSIDLFIDAALYQKYRKWEREELNEIISKYKAKTKELTAKTL